ncbi:hypothetical protein MMC24_002901 [Lignoscripta atroalba]|nr:hypothetical protein [Lignoscripta atroalba]
MAKPIREAPRDLESITALDSSLVFPSFTADDAWDLGCLLRDRLRDLTSTPTVINISLANSQQLLFHACSRPGTVPDNDHWVSRKRNSVLRWGCSSWYLQNKFLGDAMKFAERFGLGERVGDYTIYGGGVPVRVKGVEGVVAVAIVSGLKPDEDHMVVVEAMEECIQKMGKSG